MDLGVDNRPSRKELFRQGEFMPSTHLSLHYHLVFSTKERRNFIDAAWRDRLHAYMGGVIRSLNGFPEMIGGIADHVHLLIGLRATHCLSDVMRDLKSASSEWVHEEIRMAIFSWQEGYGAFTVSASNREQVSQYIKRQEEHHRHRTFQEEYRELLKRSGVEFDDRYLW
jgi:putative transposase